MVDIQKIDQELFETIRTQTGYNPRTGTIVSQHEDDTVDINSELRREELHAQSRLDNRRLDREIANDQHRRNQEAAESLRNQQEIARQNSLSSRTGRAIGSVYRATSGSSVGKVIGYGLAGASALGLIVALAELYHWLFKPDLVDVKEITPLIETIKERFKEQLSKLSEDEKVGLQRKLNEFTEYTDPITKPGSKVLKDPEYEDGLKRSIDGYVSSLPTTLKEKFISVLKYGAGALAALGAGYGALKAYKSNHQEPEKPTHTQQHAPPPVKQLPHPNKPFQKQPYQKPNQNNNQHNNQHRPFQVFNK